MFMRVDIDAIGKPADDECLVRNESFDKIFNAFAAIGGCLTCSNNAYALRILEIDVPLYIK